jgi:pimeloyl-ACP methyl ester carboxylesterase
MRAEQLAVALALTACGHEPIESAAEPQGGHPAGAGERSGGGGVSIAAGHGGAAGRPVADAGGAAAELPLTLSVFDVVQRTPVAAHDPIAGVIERVELPPWITLLANVPAGTRSVQFTSDAGTRIDDDPPFLMNEDAFGRARWRARAGEHLIRVAAFAEPGAAGVPLATLEHTLSFRETGLVPNFELLPENENETWITENIDEVMDAQTFTSSSGYSLPYRRFVPPAYDPGVKYPLLLFLHDRAARGDDNRATLYDSPLFRGSRSIVSPNFQHEFPAVVLAPQCPAEPLHHEWARWYGATEDDPSGGLVLDEGRYPSHDEPSLVLRAVRELIDEAQAELSIDPQRVYVVGESMGGTGTWDIAWRWPEVWAAAVPVAGLTDPSRARDVVDIPFWVFHSAVDTQDNVIGSLTMVDRLKVICGSVRYTQYADVSHEQTFARVWNTELLLFPWIWSQRRPPD